MPRRCSGCFSPEADSAQEAQLGQRGPMSLHLWSPYIRRGSHGEIRACPGLEKSDDCSFT
jgi:hypothetical protein